MSLTPARSLKRAADSPATGERRRTFQTPVRTPAAAGHEHRSRYRGQTPTLGSPRTPLARALRASVNHRAYESSALRREYSVDRSLISSHVENYDYVEEEELRDFQQDTVLEEMKGLPSGTVLARDGFHQVVAHGSVPDEVRHALHDVDFSSDQFRAVVDAFTGFAAVSTPQAVYVWNYAKKTFASPTCYIFHPPTPTPFVAIIPSQIPHSREPGIILVDSVTPDSTGGSGEALLYENVTLALTGAQAIKGRLGLKEVETVTSLHRVDAITLLVLTDQARILRQTISTNDSRTVLNLPTPFVKPNNTWLSRSTDAIFSGSRDQGIIGVSIGKEDIDNSLLASSTSSGLGVSMFMGTPRRHRIVEPNVALNGIGMKREVWALGLAGASGWSLTSTDAKYLKEISILGELESHPELNGYSDIRLRDIATLEHGNIAVLCAFSLRPAGRSKKTVESMSYAVAVVNPAKGPGELIEHLVKLNYSGVEDPRPVSKARLAVPQKANVAFVQLSTAVITVSLERESLYQQTTTFKDPIHNPIIDIGFDRRPISSRVGKASEGNLRLAAFAPRSGFMGIEVDPIRLFEYQPGTTSLARKEQLENKIEQSVFFDGEANPVSFTLHTDSSMSFEQAVLSVSEKVLTSSSTYLNGELDNSSLLQERQKRLSHLIQVVRQMGLLDDVSQPVRKQLAEDATVIAIAQDLYQLLPAGANHIVAETPDQLLAVAIDDLVSIMPSHEDGDDAVAVFFVKEVRGISKLLQRLPSLVQRCIAALPDDTPGGVRNWSPSWHKHACLILQAALRHAVTETRQENLEVYELDAELSDGKPNYLMDKETITAFRYFYFKAAEDVKKLRDVSKSATGHNRIQDQQLSTLADGLLLDELQEVLRALAVPLLFALEEQANLEASVIENKQDQRIAIRVKDQLIRDSHEAIMALVCFDPDLAFQVAEMFERHYTLAQLSVKADVGSSERIAAYMEGQFGRPELSADLGYRFSQELFSHYLSEKKYFSILQYSEEYRAAVSDFLRRKGRNDLAWVQFLEERKLLQAGDAALGAADAESSAHGQQILLSIAKLTRYAIKARAKESTIEDTKDLDKRLAMLKTTDLVRNRIRKSGVSSNIERTAQSFMAGRMTRLTEARLEALSQLCRSNVIQLLQGQCIDPESLIELLTMKDVKDGQDVGDFITAMKVLRDWQQQVPAATRRQTVCLRSIWRRLYLADDWSVLRDPTETDVAKQKWLDRSKLLQVLIMMRGELSSDFVVSPRSAAVPPAIEDLRDRFGSTDLFDLEILSQELDEESRQLAGMDGLNDTIVSDLTARAVNANSG